MLGLIRRELYIKKNPLTGYILCVLGYSILPAMLLFGENDDANTFTILVSLLMYPMMYYLISFFQTAILEDDRKLDVYFLASTPPSKDGIVAAKYWIVFLMSFFATIWIRLMLTFGAAFGHSVESAYTATMALMFIQLFFRSIEMPFIFRFGSKYGNYVKIGIIILVFFIVLGYFLFADVPEFISFEHFLDYMTSMFNGEGDIRNMYIWIGLFPHISVVAYYISYRLSCKGFWKGVEAYEE